MDIDEIREALFADMETQRQADIAANETSQKLGQQRIMYNNDIRGTLYSGQPTWERAQLAASGVSNLADINSKYLNKKLDIWQNITKTLDQIDSYNRAAATMNKAASNVSSGSSYIDVYNGLTGGTSGNTSDTGTSGNLLQKTLNTLKQLNSQYGGQ